MKLITFCIRYPVSVIVGIILALFGVISLTRIPLQMTPPSTAPRSRSKPPIGDLPPKKWKMRSSTARRKS